ncbi:hypothetical protein DFP72DRAFT_904274 [Ephemerocybe angulata]|uniref:Uncharacterized protein n=1 Tax=Ephemerocybe angulata TaxID=980116 RepID=A0A8H6HSZ4_9AGAR|nr:hypothetical protein DFP72DRAFT_904274 [Tulosesus angulatus]
MGSTTPLRMLRALLRLRAGIRTRGRGSSVRFWKKRSRLLPPQQSAPGSSRLPSRSQTRISLPNSMRGRRRATVTRRKMKGRMKTTKPKTSLTRPLAKPAVGNSTPRKSTRRVTPTKQAPTTLATSTTSNRTPLLSPLLAITRTYTKRKSRTMTRTESTSWLTPTSPSLTTLPTSKRTPKRKSSTISRAKSTRRRKRTTRMPLLPAARVDGSHLRYIATTSTRTKPKNMSRKRRTSKKNPSHPAATASPASAPTLGLSHPPPFPALPLALGPR